MFHYIDNKNLKNFLPNWSRFCSMYAVYCKS